MIIDCGRASDLFVTLVNARDTGFTINGFEYLVKGPSTTHLICNGQTDLILPVGASYYLSSEFATVVFGASSSVNALNNTVNAMGLGPDAFLFIAGVVVALAFVLGAHTKLGR